MNEVKAEGYWKVHTRVMLLCLSRNLPILFSRNKTEPTILLEKLTVTQLVKKFPTSYRTRSVPCSQEFATGTYPEK
jgi:hypothetical protein